MRVCRLRIENFRGIRESSILLPNHAVLIGDNNTGKTTLLEAIDLTLGPDRLNRRPPIDEHDFFQGRYLQTTSVVANGNEGEAEEATLNQVGDEEEPGQPQPRIEIEVTVTDLSDEQKAHFGDVIEFWDRSKESLYDEPDPAGVDDDGISEAIRVTFIGEYEVEDDDFVGSTYFSRSLTEGQSPEYFRKSDKQKCGFLYLRSLRTGSRALSLERGSLLDIILRLKELRPQMWEDTINHLGSYEVASDPALGITGVLNSIDTALKKYVPKEWGVRPHLKVSNLTRDHLRKVITAFIATGDGEHAAPFYRQGTGTINLLVLAMLTQIAEDKQNVIFAMEEPETAIPPYAQKRIVHEIRKLSAQTVFTSHSPYVLEEFQADETLVLQRDGDGLLSQAKIELPESVKLKRYRQEFRTRFCEGLLARRVLVCEGSTEAQLFPTVCRRLEELDPDTYKSVEALGVCVIDAGSDSQVADLGRLYRSLGKSVFGICDKQDEQAEAAIAAEVDELFMHDSHGIEDLVLDQTTEEALQRFATSFDWPPHLVAKHPQPNDDIHTSMGALFKWGKGNWILADFLASCDEGEIPEWLRIKAVRLKDLCDPSTEDVEAEVLNTDVEQAPADATD